MFIAILLSYIFASKLKKKKKKKGIFLLTALKISCSVMQTAALSENSYSHLCWRQALAETLTEVGASFTNRLACLSHCPRASQALCFQVIITLVAFLQFVFPSLIFFPLCCFQCSVIVNFIWQAIWHDNFFLFETPSLSFKLNFLIVSWVRNKACVLYFIILERKNKGMKTVRTPLQIKSRWTYMMDA